MTGAIQLIYCRGELQRIRSVRTGPGKAFRWRCECCGRDVTDWYVSTLEMDLRRTA